MKIVVVGGTGHIGLKVVALLQRTGEAVVVASPSNGVDAVTGEGLAHALEYADAVVDVSNPRELDGAHAHDFFVAAAYRRRFFGQRSSSNSRTRSRPGTRRRTPSDSLRPCSSRLRPTTSRPLLFVWSLTARRSGSERSGGRRR